MHQPRIMPPLFFCLIVSVATLRGQTKPPMPSVAVSTPVAAVPPAYPKTPVEFFARARQLSDLEAAGIPFHLKATFVATGDKDYAGNGSYEEWWRDKDHWRKKAILGDFHYLAWKNGSGKAQIYTTSNFLPPPLHQTLDGVLIRIPMDVAASKWKSRDKKLGGARLISLQRDACLPAEPDNDLCVEQALFNPDGVLRIEAASGLTMVYNNFVPFNGLLIPRKILAGYAGQDTNLTILIDLLEPLNGSSAVNVAEVPAGLRALHSEMVKPLEMGGQVMPPRVVPTFTPDLRYEGPWSPFVDGRVVLDLVIDAHGKVVDAYIVHSGGRKFDDAALAAVRQYSFVPATLHGTPVPIKMRVVIDFHKH